MARKADARGEILVIGAGRDHNSIARLGRFGRARDGLEGRRGGAAVIGIAAVLGTDMPDHRAELRSRLARAIEAKHVSVSAPHSA